MTEIDEGILLLLRTSGALACLGGRPIDDCHVDPERYAVAHKAWCDGWRKAKETEND